MVQEAFILQVETENEKIWKPLFHEFGEIGKNKLIKIYSELSRKNPKKHFRIFREIILTDIIKDNKQPEEESKFML